MAIRLFTDEHGRAVVRRIVRTDPLAGHRFVLNVFTVLKKKMESAHQ